MDEKRGRTTERREKESVCASMPASGPFPSRILYRIDGRQFRLRPQILQGHFDAKRSEKLFACYKVSDLTLNAKRNGSAVKPCVYREELEGRQQRPEIMILLPLPALNDTIAAAPQSALLIQAESWTYCPTARVLSVLLNRSLLQESCNVVGESSNDG